MKWTVKKALGLIGVVICVTLLVLVAMRQITWRLFWIAIIFIAGFAYFVLPKMEE